MVRITAPWDYKDTADQEETPEIESTAFVEISYEWPGDLEIDFDVAQDPAAIVFSARVISDDADISIGTQLSPDEADELADALQSGASSIREHSE